MIKHKAKDRKLLIKRSVKQPYMQVKGQKKTSAQKENVWPGQKPLSSLFYLEKKNNQIAQNYAEKQYQSLKPLRQSFNPIQRKSSNKKTRIRMSRKYRGSQILKLKIVEVQTYPYPIMQPKQRGQRKKLSRAQSFSQKKSTSNSKLTQNKSINSNIHFNVGKKSSNNLVFKNPYIVCNLNINNKKQWKQNKKLQLQNVVSRPLTSFQKAHS